MLQQSSSSAAAAREQRVVQCSFRSLSKSQREALMAILGSLGDDELTTMQHRAHGEVTLEWRVGADHPILSVLPEPVVYSTAPRQERDRRYATNVFSGPPPLPTAATSEGQNVVLREGRSITGSSPRGRNISPAAAAARRGAAARNRSHSPRPAMPGSSPFRGSPSRGDSAAGTVARSQRTVQWACRTIDEIFTACRRLRVDTTRTTTVEELVQHVLTNRYGATPTTRRMCAELAAAAQQYSNVSPLCLLHFTFCGKRTVADVREYILVAKIVGALAPWSSRESVRTAVGPGSAYQQQQHVVSLRRYISDGDVALALRDAVGVMLRKGSPLASAIRRYVSQWLRRPPTSSPIAFDFAGHVDSDILSMVLVEGLREAKAEAQRMQSEYGEFLSGGQHGRGAADEEEDYVHAYDEGVQDNFQHDAATGTSKEQFAPRHLLDNINEHIDDDAGRRQALRSSYDADDMYARRQHVQSEDLVEVIAQRRMLEEVRLVEGRELHHGHHRQPQQPAQQRQLQGYPLPPQAHILHASQPSQVRQLSVSPPRSQLPQPTTRTTGTAAAAPRQVALQSLHHQHGAERHRQSTPPLGRATQASPLVVTLPTRQPRNHSDDEDDIVTKSYQQRHEEVANNQERRRRGDAVPHHNPANDVMGSLLAHRDEAIMRALEEHMSQGQRTIATRPAHSGVDEDSYEYEPLRGGKKAVEDIHSTPPPASSTHSHHHVGSPSPLASSPFQADLSDMRSTLQAIEDELRRRQSTTPANGAGGPSQSSVEHRGHQQHQPLHPQHQIFDRHKDPFQDRYEFGRSAKPPLFSPPRPHAELRNHYAEVTTTYGNTSSALPPRSVASIGRAGGGGGSGALSPSQGLQDDERLLLEQLEQSLRARKAASASSTTAHPPPPAPRRPLEMVAEPL